MISRDIKPIIIVQGAQWGSEGKGMVASTLCKQESVDYAVRTGTVNAGHTVYYNGAAFKMQQLPTGWTNPETVLCIGPGAYIHPDILEQECDMVDTAMGLYGSHSVKRRLYIDYRCGLHLPSHQQQAKESGQHYSIGATGKGASHAVVEKIRRRGSIGAQLFRDYQNYHPASVYNLSDVSDLLYDKITKWGKKVLIEGTQGTLLDLHLGPYPYVTHKQTQAANWMAECGLPITLPLDLVLVARTFPIRVAGNSGPMPDETNWVYLAREINTKRDEAGLGPIVDESSLKAFEYAMEDVVETAPHLYPSTHPTRPDKWLPEDRLKYQIGASELHRDALGMLSDDVVRNLMNLFEMTTVTKKLRRISRWNEWAVMTPSVKFNRPTRMIITFMNYLFPVLGEAGSNWWEHSSWQESREWTQGVEARLGVSVSHVSVGPFDHQLIPVPTTPWKK